MTDAIDNHGSVLSTVSKSAQDIAQVKSKLRTSSSSARISRVVLSWSLPVMSLMNREARKTLDTVLDWKLSILSSNLDQQPSDAEHSSTASITRKPRE